jgi:hypothetical protein
VEAVGAATATSRSGNALVMCPPLPRKRLENDEETTRRRRNVRKCYMRTPGVHSKNDLENDRAGQSRGVESDRSFLGGAFLGT